MKLTKLDWLLLLTLSVLTFEKIRWETSDLTLTWTNLLATTFVVVFIVDRIRRRDLMLHPAAIEPSPTPIVRALGRYRRSTGRRTIRPAMSPSAAERDRVRICTMNMKSSSSPRRRRPLRSPR